MMITVEIKLTQGQVALIDGEDYALIKNYKWRADYIGNTVYAVTVIYKNSKAHKVYMHRLIMSPKKGQLVDHINRKGLDNRKDNLRLASKSQNAANSKCSTGSSKYKGVWWRKDTQKWSAKIMVDNKGVSLGCFCSEEAAAEAYNEAAKKYFGEFALLNTIDGGYNEA